MRTKPVTGLPWAARRQRVNYSDRPPTAFPVSSKNFSSCFLVVHHFAISAAPLDGASGRIGRCAFGRGAKKGDGSTLAAC